MKLKTFTGTSFDSAMICITPDTEKTIMDVCQGISDCWLIL